MKRFATFVLLVCLLLVCGCDGKRGEKSSGESADEFQRVRLVMATNGTDEGIDTIMARRFAELVKEDSDGHVIVEVYPRDQLAGGNTTKGVAMLADGSVDLAAYTSSNLAILDPHLSIVTLPWAFDNLEAARKGIEEEGGAYYYEKVLADKGLAYLGYVHNGMRQISSGVWPVRTPEDLKFLKIRVTGNMESFRFFSSLGASPMPMSWSELPEALRQGAVDGYEAGFFHSHSARLERFTKYTTVLNYTYEAYIFMANSKTFDQLEPKTRQVLREKAAEACAWGRQQMEERDADARQKFVESGVVVIELSPEERAAFIEQSRSIVGRIKKQYGEDACRAFGIPFE